VLALPTTTAATTTATAAATTAAAGSAEEDAADGGRRVRLVSRRYHAGQVRAFGSSHLHDVAALAGTRAVTLHVYAPRLTTMTRYALDGGRLVVTSREREGADW